MTDVRQAIKTKWDATPALNSCALFSGVVPPDSTRPYCRMTEPPGYPGSLVLGSGDVMRPRIQLTAFKVGSDDAGSLGDLIANTFDNYVATLGTTDRMVMQRDQEPVLLFEEYDAQSNPVFSCTVIFDLFVNRN